MKYNINNMDIRSFSSMIIYDKRIKDNNLYLTIGFPVPIDESKVNYKVIQKNDKYQLIVDIKDVFKYGLNFGVILDENINKNEVNIEYNNGIISLQAPIS